MKKSLCAAVAAAVVAAIGLPASAAAAPPITPPGFSTCTFAMGLTTCVQSLVFVSVTVEEIEDATCPTGIRLRITEESETTTTTWVFRGVHQLGEPTTETTRTPPTTTEKCESPGPGRS
jgi:hypothetical protein